ncbi:MAG: COP23 domain-containing protein [Cyanobacteria bacterium J06626_23]
MVTRVSIGGVLTSVAVCLAGEFAFFEAQAQLDEAASRLQFSCIVDTDVPELMARTGDVKVSVVSWDSAEIAISPESTPAADCQASAARFQTLHDAGLLHYITTGRMDGQLVVCAAEVAQGRCVGRLFDLVSTQRPRRSLQRVLSIRLPTEGPIEETGPRPYVSWTRLLQGDYMSEN